MHYIFTIQGSFEYFSFKSLFNNCFPLKIIPDKSKLLLDISARLWFTYRRKFAPIGEYAAFQLPGYGLAGLVMVLGTEKLFLQY